MGTRAGALRASTCLMAASAAALLLLPLTGAAAETQANNEQAPVDSEESSMAQPAELQDIVVTARKRLENLQDVPVSITAFTDETLDQQNIRTATDLGTITPNLVVDASTVGNFNPGFTLRGISSSARNVGFESSLGVYIDGVFVGRTSGFDQTLTDVARVEVLRGPQGTLFGKNTISGAINITTHEPTEVLSGNVTAEYGNYDLLRGDALISGPLVPGTLGASLSVFGLRRDGFVKNINSAGTGPDRLGDDESWGARGTLALRAGEGLEFILRGDWAKDQGTIYEAEVSAGFGFAPGIREVDVDSASTDEREAGGVSLTANLDLPGDHRLVSISAYRSLDYGFRGLDLDVTPLSLLDATIQEGLDQFSQEVRLESGANRRLSYIVGLYYFQQDTESVRDSFLGEDSGLAPLNVGIDSQVDTRSYAAFANIDFKITAQVSVSAGARYTREEKDLYYRQRDADLIGFPSFVLEDDLTDTEFSPTLTLNFKPSDDILAYLRYARGFKSGGWNTDFLGTGGPLPSIEDISFDSESITSYEAGLKTTLLDRRLRANLALFYLQYKDIQVSQFVGGLAGFRTTNAGKAHAQGFELELTAAPVRGLTFYGNVGYTDGEYDEFRDADTSGRDLSGTRLLVPKWTAAFGGQYSFGLSNGVNLVGGADYSLRSGTPQDPLDENSGTDSYNLVDARLGLEGDAGWSLYAWVENLFKERYLTSRFTSTTLDIFGLSQLREAYGPPRRYGVRLGYRF